MNLDLRDKRAIVCGSSQGIGKAAAIELAALGATVTLIARNEDKLVAVVRELPASAGQQHDYIVADFAFPDALDRILATQLQNKAVHILVNNTGGPPAGALIDATRGQISQAFGAHLLCNHILAQHTVPLMKAAGYGRIINVISTSVKIPIRNLGVSNTTRGAVANWSKTLSLELARFNITVNNVLPGSTMTARLESMMKDRAQQTGKAYEQVKEETGDEVPAGRIGDAAEVAAAIAFLATPAASYINGINLPVDGGRTGSY